MLWENAKVYAVSVNLVHPKAMEKDLASQTKELLALGTEPRLAAKARVSKETAGFAANLGIVKVAVHKIPLNEKGNLVALKAPDEKGFGKSGKGKGAEQGGAIGIGAKAKVHTDDKPEGHRKTQD